MVAVSSETVVSMESQACSLDIAEPSATSKSGKNDRIDVELRTKDELQNDLSTLGAHKHQEPEPLSILIVGDGDLSYALSYMRLVRKYNWPVRVVATTLDTEEELTKIYARFPEIRDELRNGDAYPLFGIDATNLEAHEEALFAKWDLKDRQFDRIVFNFPHYCGKSRLNVNRKLLEDFFASSIKYLNRESGEIWVSLLGGQGGTAGEYLKRHIRYGCTWQVQDKAADVGLMFKDCIRVDDGLQELEIVGGELGYKRKGYRNGDRGYHTSGALSHVFAFPHHVHCTRNIHAQVWKKSISFFIDPASFSVDFLHQTIRELKPGLRFETSKYSDFVYPENGLTTRTYRCVFFAENVVLSQSQSHELMMNIRYKMHHLVKDTLDKHEVKIDY